MQDFDVIILGGGAAGLMCASAAGQLGHRVIVLESSNKIGKKILMSGGGRCNFTNLHCEPGRFISANPNFCISALSRYTQWDFIELVQKHEIPYHEKAQGQLFCDNSSKDIVNMLQSECDAVNVRVITHCEVDTVQAEDGYQIFSNQGNFTAPTLVIATGGLSIPKMGATDFGYRLALQFGLNVLERRAGLVPFTFTGKLHDMTDRLSGVSLPATVSAGDKSFTDDILFTHRGLSGPAALQASSYWLPGSSLSINLLPFDDAEALLLDSKSSQPKSLARSLLAEHLPKSLAFELQELLWPASADKPLGDWSDADLRKLAAAVSAWTIKPAATEGYRTAEVTLGGIDTNELSSKTMECKRQAGLYCIGEVVDVTGHLGGFNFQWAWASAQAAARAI
ncbi:MAG: NAD(P)/FAD-dependent oxidoreductase [Woeseiaceae bacterium]